MNGPGDSQTAQEELLRLAKSLPEPRSFRRGVVSPPVGAGALPNNTLMFLRKHLPAQHLNWMHNRFVLIIDIKGEGEAILNNISVRLRESEALLIPPYQAHHFETFEKPIEWLFITFEMQSVERPLPAPGMTAALGKIDWELIAHLERQFIDEAKHPGASAYELSLTLALLLASLARRAASSGKAAAQTPSAKPEELLLERLNKHVYEHIDTPLTNEMLARQLGVSSGKLRTLVRKVIGESLGAYVRRIRVQIAASLLVNGHITVGEAAGRCGFNSIYAFSRCFKHITGLPPCEFARLHGMPR